jgi:glycosyltransferase involved in cell wall biosynthesis
VTDAGGSPEVVGDTGQVVPPRNAEALAEACLAVLRRPDHERREMGRRARERIAQHFEIGRIAESYLDVWRNAWTERRSTAIGRHSERAMICVE